MGFHVGLALVFGIVKSYSGMFDSIKNLQDIDDSHEERLF